MSSTRKSYLLILLMTLMVALFAFGCKKEVKVSDVYFNLVEDEQIILLIGEDLDLNNHVVVCPGNATNKGYVIESFNPEIVSVNNGVITAKAKGSAQIKVTSLQNSLKQDLMTVVVWESEVTLASPANLRYSKDGQVINFNSVPNAESYSIKINEDFYELGNSTSFKLQPQYFDIVTSVQVRANAPTYTSALKTSAFSNAIKLYQVSEAKNLIVGNRDLAFDKNSQDSVAKIYFNGQLESETNLKSMSLRELDAGYAGTKLTIDVELVLGDERRQELIQGDRSVQIFDSALVGVEVDVVALPELKLTSGILEWQKDVLIKGYEIWLGDQMLEDLNVENKIDLNAIAKLNDNAEHVIKVKPVVKDTTSNVATTSSAGEIIVKKLSAPVISLDANSVGWAEIENVSAYAFALSSNEINFESSTDKTTLDMTKYPAGQYAITVKALANDEAKDNVYFISSNKTPFSFGKHGQVEGVISDYVLHLNNEDNETVVLLDKDKADAQDISNSVEKSGEDWIVNLKTMDFAPGTHTLTLKKQYDAANKMLEGDESVVSFVQLDTVNNFAINNGTATAVVGAVNEQNDADIKIVTTGDGLSEDLVVNANTHIYNTTDAEAEGFLRAGQYESEVFVYGDGVNTFGYRENGEIVACASVVFEVLNVPVLSLNNSAKEELYISEIENAEYKVFENGVPKIENENTYQFVLNSGEKTFAVQAVGDGVNYLNSKTSDEISVSRLVSPKLQFDCETNVLTFVDENNSALVASRVLTRDGEIYDYNFVGALALTDDTEFTLTCLANVKVDGKYYLNSNTTTLYLSKLEPATNSKIENNKLIIETTEYECDLQVEFKFVGGGTEILKTGSGRVLENESYTLPYTYINNTYTINLIDENHNVLINGLLQEFDVAVVLSKNDGLHIDGETKTFEDLSLVRIDAETSIITSDNTIILTPANQSSEHGLKLSIGDEVFVSNGEHKLISATSELTYTYIDGKYNIEVLDNRYNKLVTSLAETESELQFNVKVKYAHSLSGEESDLDSDFSLEQTLVILKSSSLIRDGQSLKFNNVYPTYVAPNYSLLIDEAIEMELTENNSVLNDGTFIVDIEKVFEKLDVATHTDVHSVAVVTLNNVNNLAISHKGNTLYFTKNPTVTLSSFKDNNAEDNSTYVSFEKATQAIIQNRKYVVTFKAGEELKTKEFLDSSTALNMKLDDEEFANLTGIIEISAQVLASGEYILSDKLIQVFNSNISEKLTISRVSNDIVLDVEDAVLSWTSQQGALGYEVYKIESGSYKKLSTELVKSTSFNLNMLGVESEIELSVKAIGENEFTTNSLYAESIKVNRVSAPIVSLVDGEIVLTITAKLSEMLEAKTIEITPYILNEDQEKQVDFEKFDVDYSNNKMYIEASEILNYLGASEIVGETCKFSFKVGLNNQDENNVYYLSSATTSAKIYGLFAPTSIRKTTDENNKVEQIIWNSNIFNTVNSHAVAEKYLFKFTYTDDSEQVKEFYSNDEKLVYKNASGILEPYGIIAVSQNGEQASIFAPYGYDIGGENEVVFGAGSYSISVQAIPNSTDTGVLLASSKFSTTFEYVIMPALKLNVEAGEVSWKKQEGATSYTVYVTPNEETEARTFTVNNSDEEANIKFNFAGLPNVQGVCKVEVKALSTKENILNSEISEPSYIYRLPTAKAVNIDDGNLVFSANKYFTSAVVEFFDVSIGVVTHTETYTNNDLEASLEALAVENWQDITTEINDKIVHDDNLKLYTVKLSEEGMVLVSNKNYKINITLLGNSTLEGEHNGFISSAKYETVSNLTATKLSASVVEVKKGVVKFDAPDYIKNTPELNYVLNKTDNGDFWKNEAIIYKVDLKYGSENTVFYALDYYAFVGEIEKENSLLQADVDYKLFGSNSGYGNLCAIVFYNYGETKLVFDVYFQNTIDVAHQDHLRYHYTTEINENGENKLETILNTSEQNNGYNQIDIPNYSSFTFSITILGGDSKAEANSEGATNPNTVGCLSAFANNVRTIIRYESNTISTKDGKILFANLMKFEDETPINEPVYKFVVSPLNTVDEKQNKDKIFYVYSSSKEDAEEVALLNNDTEVEFIEIETIEDDPTKYLFDLTKYILDGTYHITIQTLAGKAEGEDGDFVINAKLPSVGTMSKVIYKLYETELYTENGVLKFKQSHTLNDGVKIYHTCYELTINNGTEDYVFKIDTSSQGVSIDASSRIVTYDLPKEIVAEDGRTLNLVEGVTYSAKIRAISGTVNGESGTMILNSTYTKNGEEDKTLSVEKAVTATDVKIENGILKWKVDDINNHSKTIVKITYESNGETHVVTKYATNYNVAYEGGVVYKYHYLTCDELDLAYRENGYSISLVVVSSAQGTLNSNPTENINLNALQVVDSSTIIAKNGNLIWEAVGNATESTKYRILISGTANLEVVVSEQELDLLTHEQTKNLPSGSYNVQIQALAGEADALNINADLSAKVSGFIKLSPVDLDNIVIENGVFKWNAVENAEKYKVVFNYTNASMNSCEDTQIVDTPSYIPPTGVNGTFSLTIWAVGVENEKLFNSDSTTYISSTEAPQPVLNFVYDDALKNRFIIEVNEDFTNSDKIVVRYNLTKYKQDGGQENLGEQVAEINYIDGQTTYYLPITVMGNYENITSQVYRKGSVPSALTYISGNINMNLFGHGSGTESEPYTIYNVVQFLNIKYYSNKQACFALGSSISFDGLDIETMVKENGGYLISETFNGVLSGGNAQQKFSIYGFNQESVNGSTQETIAFDGQYTFALFRTLEDAVLSHIDFGDQNTTLNLINTFAFDSLDMISLSWIATNSENTTIDDVDFAYSSVNINLTLNKSATNTSNSVAHGGIRIASMFATAKNTTIKNSSFVVNVNVLSDAQYISGSNVYIAGVVAHAEDCLLESLDVSFALSGSKKLTVHYSGGVYAYYKGYANTIKTIKNSEVKIAINNMYVLQFGGVAGYAENIDVVDINVSGNYQEANANHAFKVGGIVGDASGVKISECSSTVEFDITTTSNSSRYVGAIAGYIYTNNDRNSSIANCTSVAEQNQTSLAVNATSTGYVITKLGVYGSQTNVTIEGCTSVAEI